MKKHIWIAGALMVLFSSCNDFLDYNENSDYDQNSVFNITWSNEDFVTGIYAYLPGGTSDVDGALRSAGCDEAEYVWPSSTIRRFYDGRNHIIKQFGCVMIICKMVQVRLGNSFNTIRITKR